MLEVAYISPDGNLIEYFDMADGQTLEQAARTINPDTGGKFSVPVIAFVGDKPAVRKLGDWNYKLSCAKVQFRQLPMGGGGGGGGSNPLQMVMQIAIIALATAATWYIGGLGGTFLGLGMQVWGGLAGAGIMLLGTMLMGSLFQQKLPSGQMGAMSAEQASPTYSINASGNQARLNQTEPEGFGEMKIVPDFIANTWTQYIGNDQIGYFIYGIGRGKYEVKSLQFGETVFWRNGALVADSGYDIQAIQFIEPGGKVTIFPDNIETSSEVNGQNLFAPNDEEFDGAIGPYTTNSPGTKTNRLLFDFVFQQGLGQYNNNGELQEFTVAWRIEYRKVDDFGTPLSSWATLDAPSVTMATVTPQRITKTYSVADGRYQCRVIRTSETTSDGRTMDSLVWGAMRAMLPGTYEYPISAVAIAIKANNSLTQNASREFSMIVRRKLPLYNRNTKTWSAETPTRSWAAAVSHVAKCIWGGRLDDSSIDLDRLWAIDADLQSKGWFYDSYIDSPYFVWKLISEMCQSQCVIPRLIGPVLSFVQDAPNRAPSFALTPRNIVRNTFSITYMTWSDETPDDVTVEYLDNAYGFQQRDVTAKLPESESKEPSSLDILGITDRSHAHKVAVAYAAHNRWQRIVVECQIEALGRLVNRGDICTVAHPRFKNTEAGAIKDWNQANLQIYIIRDMQTKIADNTSGLYISFTKQNGELWGPCKISKMSDDSVILDQSDYSTLLLQGHGNPFEWFTSGIDRQPTTWTLYKSKTYQRLMIVDSVQSQDMLHYNLKLLNYDARIYQYGNLPVPVWQGRAQLPTVEKLGAPQGLKGTVLTNTSLTLSWLTVTGAQWYEVEISANGSNWRSVGRANINQITLSVAAGKVYARVRAANETLQSSWATWNGDTTISPPIRPDLTIIEDYTGGNAKVSWSPVSGATRYVTSLKYGNNVIYSGTTTGTSFIITPEIQEGGPYRNLICIVVSVGNGGSSQESKISLSDKAPEAPTDAVISIGQNKLILQSVIPEPQGDFTGYVIIEGANPDFSVNEVVQMRQVNILPYTWNELETGEHYFRIAVKDAFFDIAKNPLELNWSPVLAVDIE